MMYNDKIKKEYLETLETDWEIKKMETIFNGMVSLETKINKDLYDISYEDALECLDKIKTCTSYNTVDKTYNRIKKYKLWALTKGYISEQSKPFITDKSAKDNFILKSQVEIFRNPKDLIDGITVHFTEMGDDAITKSEMALASMMLSYQGFTLDEALQLTLDNIVFTENNIIIYNDRIAIMAYKEFIPLLTKVYNTRVLIENEGKSKRNKIETNYYITLTPNESDIKYTRQKVTTLIYQRITIPKKLVIKFDKLSIMGAMYEAESKGLLKYIDKDKLNILSERKKLFFFCYGTNELSRSIINNTISIFKLW